MSKHTPGPWLLDIDRSVINEAGAEVCSLNYQFETDEEEKQSEADGHLIAAAPSMLEALEKLNAMYNDFSRTTFDLVEIRSILNTAIVRATGES